MIDEIDLGDFEEWEIETLFAKLFPKIAEHFMGKKDCALVHNPSNMIAPPSGGPVQHLTFHGGSDNIISALKEIYARKADLGDAEAAVAQEGGPTPRF